MIKDKKYPDPLKDPKMEPPNNPQFPQCSNGFILGGVPFLDLFGVLGNKLPQKALIWNLV